ncbi:MAG TPA: hypothetical protein VJ835_05290 [Fimbriimonadaceae bacterium]|nr:hypothetical protein [Fimbriimonadaceae bacterium]
MKIIDWFKKPRVSARSFRLDAATAKELKRIRKKSEAARLVVPDPTLRVR